MIKIAPRCGDNDSFKWLETEARASVWNVFDQLEIIRRHLAAGTNDIDRGIRLPRIRGFRARSDVARRNLYLCVSPLLAAALTARAAYPICWLWIATPAFASRYRSRMPYVPSSRPSPIQPLIENLLPGSSLLEMPQHRARVPVARRVLQRHSLWIRPR